MYSKDLLQVIAAILLIIVGKIDANPDASRGQKKRKYWYSGALAICMLFIVVMNVIAVSFGRHRQCTTSTNGTQINDEH